MRNVIVTGFRTLAALGVVTVLLAAAYLVVPHPIVQYGAWLVIFAVWMAWFVAVAAEWISTADF